MFCQQEVKCTDFNSELLVEGLTTCFYFLFHCRNCINSLICQKTDPILKEKMFTTFPTSPTKMDAYETPTWSSHIRPWMMERYQQLPDLAHTEFKV